MKFLISLLILLLCISCNKKADTEEQTKTTNINLENDYSNKLLEDYRSEQDFFELEKFFKLIYVEYKELLKGYKISGVFSPSDVYTISANEIILDGSVLLTFKKDAKEFNVKHDYYRLNILLPSKNNYLQQFDSIQEVIIEDKDFPFWFQDVNFDKKEELIIPQYGNIRQRNAYHISFYDINGRIAKPLKGLPYDEIDDLMLDKVFDEKNKTISIFNSGGWCESSKFIYKKNESGDFDLDYYISYIEDTSGDSIRCRKDTYKVTMSLVKSEFPE